MSDGQGLRPDEAIALRLMQEIREDAETACAPDAVELVSVTFDLSAAPQAATALSYEARIDRRTRTVLFTAGAARAGEANVMTATAVYRILPAG